MRSPATPAAATTSATTAAATSAPPAPALAAVVMSGDLGSAWGVVWGGWLGSRGQVIALWGGGGCRDRDKPAERPDDVLGVTKGVLLNEVVRDNGVVLEGDQAAVDAAQATITLALPIENAGDLPHFALDPPQKSRPVQRRYLRPLRHRDRNES